MDILKRNNKKLPEDIRIHFDLYNGKCIFWESEYELVGNKVRIDRPLKCNNLDLKIPDEILLPLDVDVILSPDNRWNLYPADLFSDITTGVDIISSEISIPAWEVMNATKGINSQIRLRDFQLIERADAIVAFRPNYQQIKLSAGVQQEIEFALGLRTSYNLNLNINTIWPEDQDGSIPTRPGAFGGGAASPLHYAGPVSSVNEALELLNDLHKRKITHFEAWQNYDELVSRKKTWAFRSSKLDNRA